MVRFQWTVYALVYDELWIPVCHFWVSCCPAQTLLPIFYMCNDWGLKPRWMSMPKVLANKLQSRHLSLDLTDLKAPGFYYCCYWLNLVAWSCEKKHADLGSCKQGGLALAWIYCFKPMPICYELGIPGTSFLTTHPSHLLPSSCPSF